MENNYLDQDVNNSIGGGGLTGTDKDYLFTAAKWSRFIGIVGFVFTGLIALVLIMMLVGGGSALMDSLGALGGLTGGMAGIGITVIIIYGLVLALYFFISLYLFNFGTKMRNALNNDDSSAMTEGFKNLKSYFSLIGILIAIFVGIYALAIVIGIFGALAS